MEQQSAEQEWIEAPEGWGAADEHQEEEGGCADLFGRDPRDSFRFDLTLGDGTTRSIRLQGYKVGSDETDRSTGVTLWGAAPRLATHLQNNPEICKGKSVLEVGAGLGLCGIAAHCLGAKSVVMTDGDTQTLEKLRENIRENCSDNDAEGENAIDCRQLIWGSPHMERFAKDGQYDLVLGADVVYTPESREPLFDTVAHLLKKPHGKFVLSRYNKWHNVENEVVIDAGSAWGLDCTRPSEGIFVFHWRDDD